MKGKKLSLKRQQEVRSKVNQQKFNELTEDIKRRTTGKG